MTGAGRFRLWQRNLIGAVLAAAALAALTVLELKPAWDNYLRQVRPAYTAAKHQAVTAYGQTWEVTNVHVAPKTSYGAPLPAGTLTVSVVVGRTGPFPHGFNRPGVLPDGLRTWRGEGLGCGAESTMKWDFLVPASSTPTAVDVTKLDGSILVRLQL